MNPIITRWRGTHRNRANALAFIFTLVSLLMLPKVAEARRPMGSTMTGTVKSVDHNSRWIVFAQDDGPERKFVYAKRAQFWHDMSDSSPTDLSAGLRVQVKLHQPLIGPDFVTQIVLILQPHVAPP